MKKIACALSAIVVFLGLWLSYPGTAMSQEPGYYEDAPPLMSPAELDDLLAPIALYPDPLIAQILPAATFVDQVDEAARYVRQYGSYARVDDQPWDVSVRAVAHYPDVLYMMDQKMEWTVALGQAYIDQPQDVMDSIQRLRAYAYTEGNLYSTPQQQVVAEDDYYRIVPASPQYVYVPVYDPEVVYLEPYDPYYPFVTFGFGFAIGAWLSRDCDWRHHRVYYHGWRGGGWVGRSRPHIHDRRGIYINRRASVINVNNRVLQRDTSRYRQQLRTEPWRGREARPVARPGTPTGPRPGVVTRPQGRGRQAPAGQRPQATTGGRQQAPERGRGAATSGSRQRAPERERQPATGGRERSPERQRSTTGGTVNIIPSNPAAPATATPRSGASQAGTAATRQAAPAARGAAPAATELPKPVRGHRPQQLQQRTGTPEVYRGKDVQKTQPASQSGYGGYGTGRDATIYRERGESSRSNMQQYNRPAGRHGSTAAPRSSVPGTTSSPRPVVTAPAPAMRTAPTVVAPQPRAATPAPRAVAPQPRAATPAPRAVAPQPRAVAPSVPAQRPLAVPSAPRSAPAVQPATPAAPMQRR